MANPNGTQSRVFVIAAIGLVGLLMVGLLAIAGLVVYTRFIAPSPSPTVVAEATITPGVTPSPTATKPASPVATPSPGGAAPTATKVIEGATPAPGGQTPGPEEGTPTATPTGGGEMAPTGFGPLEAAVVGVVLLLVILFVRRVRFSAGARGE